MTRIIKFTDTTQGMLDVNPIPASKMIPDWYKNTESYMNKTKAPVGNGQTAATIKRCMPVFDVLSAGYYLVTHADVWVSQVAPDPEKPNEKIPWFQWSSGEIQFHPVSQVLLHPESTGTDMPKWINPWSIETPKGYSTLFIAPVHRDNPFVALPGIVDTDTYNAPVNIIFTLADPNFEGLVPKGTPIVQVIPFKREPWKMQFGNEEDNKKIHKQKLKLKSTFFDGYKSMFRQPKEHN